MLRAPRDGLGVRQVKVTPTRPRSAATLPHKAHKGGGQETPGVLLVLSSPHVGEVSRLCETVGGNLPLAKRLTPLRTCPFFNSSIRQHGID